MSYEVIFDEQGIADDLLTVFREGRPPIVRGITDVLMGRRRGEIVRCRDCLKWHGFDVMDGKRYGECDEWKRLDSYCSPATAEDGFCAWGERSES